MENFIVSYHRLSPESCGLRILCSHLEEIGDAFDDAVLSLCVNSGVTQKSQFANYRRSGIQI